MSALTAIWGSSAWRTDALTWIDEHLRAHGLRLTGPVTQPHLRPWSTILQVPTSGGSVWFKANGPGTAFEPRVLDAFGRWRAPHVGRPLAVDVDLGWSLLPDAGEPLRALTSKEAQVASWLEALPAYAELQQDLTPRVGDLLALGVPDLRPPTLPGHYAALLADPGRLLLGEPDGLAVEDLTRLQRLVPDVARWAEQLASSGIPPTVQHDDLHHGNVFVRRSDALPAYVFIDWGDASVAHPFGTLLVTLRSVAARLELPPTAPELGKLRDAYLEPWTTDHGREELLAAVRAATELAKVGRALAWERALADSTEAERAPYAEAVPGWLRELLE